MSEDDGVEYQELSTSKTRVRVSQSFSRKPLPARANTIIQDFSLDDELSESGSVDFVAMEAFENMSQFGDSDSQQSTMSETKFKNKPYSWRIKHTLLKVWIVMGQNDLF